jgi:enterochelin esterase-like enzyme
VGLTSTTLLVLAAFLAVSLPVAAVTLWNRLPGTQLVRVGGRLSLVVLAQVFAVLLVLVTVNDQYLFYVSWQDLLGSTPAPGVITTVQHLDPVTSQPNTGTVYHGPVSTKTDDGQLLQVILRGGRSHVTGRVLIHLPAGYDATSPRRYPVIELLQGWHAPPESWMNNLHIFESMALAQHSGGLGPVITVMPDINVAVPRDAECTNIPHGPQVETFLTTDVRDLVLSQYRALPARTSWGLMGYSTGGYCAAKFAFHRPDRYGAAVVMSGYFDAIKDKTTHDLWGGSQQYRNQNSVLWLLAHRPAPLIDVLAFASVYDKESYSTTAQFLALPPGQMQVSSLIVPRGGHNFKALRAALPEMLVWLGTRLSDLPPALPAAPRPSSTYGPKVPVQHRPPRTAHPKPSASPRPIDRPPLGPSPSQTTKQTPTSTPKPSRPPSSVPERQAGG